MAPSPKTIALAAIPKIVAVPSLLGSLYIVVDVARNRWSGAVASRKQSTNSTYNRLLAAMSCIDVLTSLCYFLGTWPIPIDSGPYLASGNAATCVAQGFVIQAGLAIPFYNLSLSTYYLLVVKLGWKQRRISAIEKYLHGIPLLVGLGTSVAAACLDLFHNSNLWCWIAANEANDNNFDFYRWLLFYGPLWCSIFGVTVSMASMTRHVLATQRSGNIGSSLNNTDRKKSLRKQTVHQALSFVGAMYLAWTFATVSRIVQATTGSIPYPLIVMFVLTLPGQGFWNFLVYIRPRYLRYLRNQKKNKKQDTKKGGGGVGQDKEKKEKEGRNKSDKKKEDDGSSDRDPSIQVGISNTDVSAPKPSIEPSDNNDEESQDNGKTLNEDIKRVYFEDNIIDEGSCAEDIVDNPACLLSNMQSTAIQTGSDHTPEHGDDGDVAHDIVDNPACLLSEQIMGSQVQ